MSSGRQTNPFGRLLKFWRATFSYSQEQFAEALNVSTRHLSFLENGRAVATLAVINEISKVLALGPRDRGNLMLAAGHLPYTQAADLNDPEHVALRTSLRLTLRSFDPFAAAVIDPCANVKMVNRAWVFAHRRAFGESIMRQDINTIRLLVAEDGWRRYLPEWTDLACIYLVILQQEAIMRDSLEAEQLLAEILAVEGVPRDWAVRGAKASPTGSNQREVRRSRGKDRVFLNVHHTVGSTAYVAEPRLLIQALLPEDGQPDAPLEQLYADDSLLHPLLAV